MKDTAPLENSSAKRKPEEKTLREIVRKTASEKYDSDMADNPPFNG
jgi:hypothetical protein